MSVRTLGLKSQKHAIWKDSICGGESGVDIFLIRSDLNPNYAYVEKSF
jgi:hypothetical protein